MTAKLLCRLLGLLFAGMSLASGADTPPSVCQPVQAADLQGIEDPYSQKAAPDGSSYCEGLLPRPIALRAPEVVSATRDQDAKPVFKKGTIATLRWCDISADRAHVELRAVKPPLFALDAQAVSEFRWSADSIAKWHPDWTDLKAFATRPAAVGGEKINLLIPVSSGPAKADTYTLMFQSENPVYFDTAYLEPVAPAAKGIPVKATLQQGNAKNIWIVRFSLLGVPQGILRVSLQETGKSGGVAKPFYFLHKSCAK